MNPVMFRGNEHKRQYQEVLQEVRNDRVYGQNPSKVMVKAASGLGGILVAMMVAGLWLG